MASPVGTYWVTITWRNQRTNRQERTNYTTYARSEEDAREIGEYRFVDRNPSWAVVEHVASRPVQSIKELVKSYG